MLLTLSRGASNNLRVLGAVQISPGGLFIYFRRPRDEAIQSSRAFIILPFLLFVASALESARVDGGTKIERALPTDFYNNQSEANGQQVNGADATSGNL